MDLSVFTEKTKIPDDSDLHKSLKGTYALWNKIRAYVTGKYPGASEEWYHSGKKYGWNFRIKDKKRAIIYLLPRDGYFKVAFVFGQKATDIILKSDISDEIKKSLKIARVYAEGRGIRVDVLNEKILRDIKKLVDIKLEN